MGIMEMGTLGTGSVWGGEEFSTCRASVVVTGTGTGELLRLGGVYFLNMLLISNSLFLDSECSGGRRLEFVVSLIAFVRSLAAAMMRSVFDAVGILIP